MFLVFQYKGIKLQYMLKYMLNYIVQARPGGGGVQGYCNTRFFWHQIPIYPNLGETKDTKYQKYRKIEILNPNVLNSFGKY